MASSALRREEVAGLAVALAAHAGLLALLVLHPGSAPVIPTPDRINVTLSEDVGLVSTSPEPQAAAAPPAAPDIAPVPESVPESASPPVSQPQIKPAPVAMPTPQPRPVPRPLPRPQAQLTPAPRTASASRISSDFLKGVPGAQASGAAHNPPATAIGPAVQSALSGAISRQLKPHWAAPQGADAEKLVSILTWNLNRDGSLAGLPRLVRQEGITEANRAQAARHAEQAMRAVQLAAPFTLPAEYYSAWQRVASFRFDKRLSQ